MSDFSVYGLMEVKTNHFQRACPPPISINTNNWNGVLDTQPMCDFAEGINPFVLLFAALISAYIVAGIRTSGH